MTVLLSPTAVRALLLAVFLACAAALTAPAARGDSGAPRPSRPCATAVTAEAAVAHVLPVLADEFSWREFTKYWGRQAGSLSGIVGTVLLVAALAVLIIMSKGRG